MQFSLLAVVDLVSGLTAGSAGCLALLMGVVTVAGALLRLQWRQQRQQARDHEREIARVLGRLDAAERRISQLEQALRAANVPLPPSS